MATRGFHPISARLADWYDLRRLADRWDLSLADTVHILIASNVKALGWDITRTEPLTSGLRRTSRRERLPHPERPAHWTDADRPHP